MSGDHGQDNYNEVQAMKQTALDEGVPSSDIFMDHAGFSTYDSMIRARDVFKVKKALVVTQRYHLYRAVYIARSLGIDCIGIQTEDYSYSGQLHRTVREYAARCKDIFTVMLHTPPYYGGEPISIKGDGNLTND